jgi:hypothetical protein
MEALLYLSEEAWHRSDSRDVWRQLDRPLAEEQHYWQGLVGGVWGPSILLDGRFNLEQAVAAYESALALASARLQVLLLLGELAAARHYAEAVKDWHDKAVLPLTTPDIVRCRVRVLAEATGLCEADARAQLLEKSRNFLAVVSEVQFHLADRPSLIEHLMDRGIDGYSFVKELRGRQDVPLLLLPRP